MKITCTEYQKPLIVEALASSYHCFLPQPKRGHCKFEDSCSECLEKNIEWQIEDGDGNADGTAQIPG